MSRYDYMIIGAGMAGASAAWALSAHGAVVLIELEARGGYHATGRSAALFTETYGNALIRGLTRASRSFLERPPEDFADQPLLKPRGVIHIASDDQRASLAVLEREEAASGSVVPITPQEILRRVPILRPEAAVAGLFEPGATDIDVDALHQGYLRGLRRRGGVLVTDAGVEHLDRERGRWTARTKAGVFSAPVIVDAAGAWADQIAIQAGATPVGLRPKRRTAVLVEAPPGDVARWPMVVDADETLYFKPDAGRLLISPADETDSAPMDAFPEELDVAIALDRLQTLTTLEVRRVLHKWAGLRTFAPDRSPVCGYDAHAEDFFWLAGQGGYGIQTAPALAGLAESLIVGRSLSDAAFLGLDLGALSPNRFCP